MCPSWRQYGRRCGPRRPNVGPIWPQVSCICLQVGPKIARSMANQKHRKTLGKPMNFHDCSVQVKPRIADMKANLTASWSKSTPSRAKLTPSWPKLVPSRVQIAFDWLHVAISCRQLVPRWFHEGPNWCQDDLMYAQVGGNMAESRAQDGQM